MAEPDFRWTQDDWGESGPGARKIGAIPTTWNRNWIVRAILLLVAVLLFELMASAALSTVVGWLEFGRNDLVIARWLRRTDPDRRRGRLEARSYWAWAFLKVSLIASLLVIVVGVFETLQHPGGVRGPGAPHPYDLLAACVVSFLGLLASWWFSYWTVLSAFLSRTKLWIGPEPSHARGQAVWPPTSLEGNRHASNRASLVVLSALVPSLFLLTIFELVLLYKLIGKQHIIVFVLVGIVSSSVLLAKLFPILKRRVVAQSPEDCWMTQLSALST